MGVRECDVSLGRFRYVDEGEGPTILLIHSLGTSRALWSEVVERLSPRYRLIVPDLLGHGDSDKPSRELTIPDHAGLLIELMDGLQVERFAVAGTSLGGLLTLELGARYGDRLTAIICNGAPGWHLESQRMARLTTVAGLIGPDGLPRPGTAPGGTVREVTPERAEQRRADLDRAGRWFMSSMWAIASYDPIARLEHIVTPTLILMGDGDYHMPTSYVLVDGIRHSRLEVISNAGHLTPYDEPAGVSDAIHNHITDHAGKPVG